MQFFFPSSHEAVVFPTAVIAKTYVSSIQMSSSPKVLDLDEQASVVRNPTIIRVTLLCGRALSERALWLLLKLIERCLRRVRKKTSFGKGLFSKINFLETLENLEILENLLWKTKENLLIF